MAMTGIDLVQFDGFFCVIAEVSPTDERTFTFTEDITPERMTPRQFFCDEFTYLGVTITPGMMTQDLPARTVGDHVMKPVAQDRNSYYLNAFVNDFEFHDGTSVEAKRIYLATSQSYPVEHDQCVMIGVGSVKVTHGDEVVEITAPAIIDARVGNITIEALTDSVICELWL